MHIKDTIRRTSIVSLFRLDKFSSLDSRIMVTTYILLLLVQVDKLKVLSESLASSTTKAEKRISEQRYKTVLVACLSTTDAGILGQVI